VPEQASQVRRHFAQRRRSDAVANIEDAVSAFACEQLENGILVGEPTDLLPPGPERLRALGIPSGMDTRASVLAYVGLAARRTPSVHTERAARICTELVAITHDLDAGTATPHDAISRVAGIQRDVSGPRPRGNAVDEVAEGIVFDFDMRVRNAEPSVVHATISAFLDDVAATIVNRAPDLQEPLSFAGSVEHTL